MSELHLTFYCATVDRDTVVAALRAAIKSPVHARAEQVFGHDFGDARTEEQVRGSLDRAAIELALLESDLDCVLAAVAGARRALPVRWRASPITRMGRIG
jgi:hypothetical protein